jgi:hypothetical protein
MYFYKSLPTPHGERKYKTCKENITVFISAIQIINTDFYQGQEIAAINITDIVF